MKNNKERVFDALLSFGNENTNQQTLGLTTTELAEILGIQRTNISSLLNTLVEEGRVEKSEGRPVYYWTLNGTIPSSEESCFDELIGHDGSLKNAVGLIKAAVLYPQARFNVLIVGEKGTGKSYFAYLVYRFAVEQRVFAKETPYVRINCKNYIGHEEQLTEDLFARKEENYFDQAEGGFLFIDSVDLLVGKNRSRLLHYIEQKEFFYLDEEKPEKKNVALILACDERINQEVIDYYSQKIMINIKLPNLSMRPLKERFQFINQFFSMEASQANQTFEVTNEVLRCLMLFDCPYNLRQLEGDIRIACANAFVRNRNNGDSHILVVMSDFTDNIRQGLLNYKKHRDEIERIIPEDFNYVFSKESIIEKSIVTFQSRESIYEVIEQKTNELKDRGLQEDEISLIASSHIQTVFEQYQKYLTKQALNLGQLSKVVDVQIIEEVQKFLDIAQEKFSTSYPVSLYYGLALHVGTLVESKGRTQQLGNKQIMEIVSQYNQEYLYCLQFINHIEELKQISIPVDEAVILTMFLIKKEQIDQKVNPVILIAMHGSQAASSVAEVINTLVKANNAYGFDMSLDSEPNDIYEELKEMVIRINQGKGVIIIYDMGSFKNMFLTIAEETGIEIRLMYMPITLLGIEASRRTSLDEDIDSVYHQLLLSTRDLFAGEYQEYKSPVIVTLCNTGEGGAIELKKYIELHTSKSREIIPLAISDRKQLVEKIKDVLEIHRIHCFVGTYNPNLFGIPFISIQEIFECNPERIDNLLDFNPAHTDGIDMEAIYEYLDESLEYVDIQKIRKLLPTLLDHLEEANNDVLSLDQKLGLFVHIACSINRACAKETTPINIKKTQIFMKYEQLTKEVAKCFKPIEKSFDIIITDDEIANIICIIKKL